MSGGRGCSSKDDIQKHICIKFDNYINFFKYTFFGFKPWQRRFCDKFGIQNRSPGEKILKIDKKPAILRFFNFYQFERLLKAMKDKIIFGFYFFLLFSRYISTN